MLDPTSAGRPAIVQTGGSLCTHGSGLIEKALEYQFLAAVTAELLRRGMRYEVLRGDFDLDGYDVVVEAGGIARHVQLKCMAAGSRTSSVPINTRLREKPSGCVVWMTYDPGELTIEDMRWFGDRPGIPLPDPGTKVARHSRANSNGIKAIRPEIRILPARAFSGVRDIANLADLLFGPADQVLLKRHLRARVEDQVDWLGRVQAGDFTAIPANLDWESSTELAMLIDGYQLADELRLGEPVAFEERQLAHALQSGDWPGNAAELWVTLFLEQRRWYFSSPHDPDPHMKVLLDRLVTTLYRALNGSIM